MVLRCRFHQPLEFFDGLRCCISKGFVALCCQHGSGIASLMSLVCCLFVVVNLVLYSLWLSSCNTRCIGVSTISVLLFVALQSIIDSIQCLLLCLDGSQSGLIGGHVGSLSSSSLVNSLYLCSKLTTCGALPHLVDHVFLVCPFSVIHQKLEPIGNLGSLIGEFCCLIVAFYNLVDGIAQLTLQYLAVSIELIDQSQSRIPNLEFSLPFGRHNYFHFLYDITFYCKLKILRNLLIINLDSNIVGASGNIIESVGSWSQRNLLADGGSIRRCDYPVHKG